MFLEKAYVGSHLEIPAERRVVWPKAWHGMGRQPACFHFNLVRHRAVRRGLEPRPRSDRVRTWRAHRDLRLRALQILATERRLSASQLGHVQPRHVTPTRKQGQFTVWWPCHLARPVNFPGPWPLFVEC